MSTKFRMQIKELYDIEIFQRMYNPQRVYYMDMQLTNEDDLIEFIDCFEEKDIVLLDEYDRTYTKEEIIKEIGLLEYESGDNFRERVEERTNNN